MRAEPVVTLVRHGQTEWSLDGRHTGSTDIPLTPAGEEQARCLARVLDPRDYDLVVVSPRERAMMTAKLAGFSGSLDVWDELSEWDYGQYEGITSKEIRESRPGWTIFEDGAPGGESPSEIGSRADRVIADLRASGARNVLVFAHGHILRVIGARWIGLEAAGGIRLVLSTASVSELGYEHGTEALTRWNDTAHLQLG